MNYRSYVRDLTFSLPAPSSSGKSVGFAAALFAATTIN